MDTGEIICFMVIEIESCLLYTSTKKLEISYIGMLSQEAVIKPGTPVKVILKEDTEELDEVVIS